MSQVPEPQKMHCIESFDVSRCRQRLQTQTGDITCSVILKKCMRFVMTGCRSLRGELHASRERTALRARQAERRSRARKSVRGPGGTPRRRRQPGTSVRRRTTQGIHRYLLAHYCTRSTQPCIPPWSLNRVPASAGVMAGMSARPGGR